MIDRTQHLQFGQQLLPATVEWITENLTPDEVFPEWRLAEWAQQNGYLLLTVSKSREIRVDRPVYAQP